LHNTLHNAAAAVADGEHGYTNSEWSLLVPVVEHIEQSASYQQVPGELGYTIKHNNENSYASGAAVLLLLLSVAHGAEHSCTESIQRPSTICILLPADIAGFCSMQSIHLVQVVHLQLIIFPDVTPEDASEAKPPAILVF
jgi:hypothetical protein